MIDWSYPAPVLAVVLWAIAVACLAFAVSLWRRGDIEDKQLAFGMSLTGALCIGCDLILWFGT